MNIFYLHFSDGLSLVPSYLANRLDIHDVHIACNGRPSASTKFKRCLDYRECTLGHFQDWSKYSEMPIDANILKDMSECESTVLKMLDRYQFSHGLLTYEERINLYHKQLRYWYNYLIIEKIDVCVFAVIPHVVFDFIIYSLCKYLGIKTFMLYRLPALPGKNVSLYVLRDINEHICRLKESYNDHLTNPGKSSLSGRMAAYLELKEGNKGKTFTGVEYRERNINKYLQIRNYIKYVNYVALRAKPWLKLWGNPIDLMYRTVYSISQSMQDKPVLQNAPDLTCKYIYVSLHYQPECTTSPMGGVFVHQDLMIDILKRAVPQDIKIYIKGHLRDGMSATLFKRFHADSRTVLIDPSLNSFDLIINSVAVATITGTAGWEAFLNNKPVLMFGNYFYQDAPGVYKIKSANDSVKAISEIIDGKNNISDEMIIAFLKAVEENTFPGWVDNRYASMSGLTDDENCRNIADHLATEINYV